MFYAQRQQLAWTNIQDSPYVGIQQSQYTVNSLNFFLPFKQHILKCYVPGTEIRLEMKYTPPIKIILKHFQAITVYLLMDHPVRIVTFYAINGLISFEY